MNLSDLTIVVCTARRFPEVSWIWEAVESQMRNPDDRPQMMIIDALETGAGINPRPNIWSGSQRITKRDCWSKPVSINTAICHVGTPWILFLDDRQLPIPGFFQAVYENIMARTIMFGRYEKRINIEVQSGLLSKQGEVIGEDDRNKIAQGTPRPCGGEWAYGHCVLIPLEWALLTNGSPEECCGMGFEDAIWGLIMQNNSLPMVYDPRAFLIEDRTGNLIGEPFYRTAKARHDNDKEDKAWTMLKRVKTMKQSIQPFGNLEALREKIQAGRKFPDVDNSREYRDWFDLSRVVDYV